MLGIIVDASFVPFLWDRNRDTPVIVVLHDQNNGSCTASCVYTGQAVVYFTTAEGVSWTRHDHSKGVPEGQFSSRLVLQQNQKKQDIYSIEGTTHHLRVLDVPFISLAEAKQQRLDLEAELQQVKDQLQRLQDERQLAQARRTGHRLNTSFPTPSEISDLYRDVTERETAVPELLIEQSMTTSEFRCWLHQLYKAAEELVRDALSGELGVKASERFYFLPSRRISTQAKTRTALQDAFPQWISALPPEQLLRPSPPKPELHDVGENLFQVFVACCLTQPPIAIDDSETLPDVMSVPKQQFLDIVPRKSDLKQGQLVIAIPGLVTTQDQDNDRTLIVKPSYLWLTCDVDEAGDSMDTSETDDSRDQEAGQAGVCPADGTPATNGGNEQDQDQVQSQVQAAQQAAGQAGVCPADGTPVPDSGNEQDQDQVQGQAAQQAAGQAGDGSADGTPVPDGSNEQNQGKNM